MARSRNIKPGFFTNDVLAEVQPLGRLLFAGLWTLADREGRLECRVKRIKASVLPYDDCDVDALLTELQERGFIVRYAVGEDEFIQVLNFAKHQNPHKNETESVIPTPEEIGSAPEIIGTRPEEIGSAPADSLLLIPDSLNPSEDIPPATPSASKKSPRGGRLPSEWKLPKPWGEWALGEKPGWSAEDVRQCSLRFADFWHAKAGKDAAKLDWQATWRNWVRNDRGTVSMGNVRNSEQGFVPPTIPGRIAA